MESKSLKKFCMLALEILEPPIFMKFLFRSETYKTIYKIPNISRRVIFSPFISIGLISSFIFLHVEGELKKISPKPDSFSSDFMKVLIPRSGLPTQNSSLSIFHLTYIVKSFHQILFDHTLPKNLYLELMK